jgi:hypothetical protein
VRSDIAKLERYSYFNEWHKHTYMMTRIIRQCDEQHETIHSKFMSMKDNIYYSND